ncbi:MAG TPA: ribonuclease HII [Dongiaceae bacterium]|jgi:ribonuclease HII
MRRPSFAIEKTIEGPVAGIDEAGRGPLAGPVVAAAVIFHTMPSRRKLRRIDDSKQMLPEEREEVFAWLPDYAHIGVASASVEEIDTLNILWASMLAMKRALEGLGVNPIAALVDGNTEPPDIPCPVRCVVAGDATSLSIAAASIVAKVTRDRRMVVLAERYPGYGWERNMGYGTPEHRLGIDCLGINSQHRRTFRPIYELLTTSY